MIRFRELRPSSFGNGPPTTRYPNYEDEILSGSAAARIVTWYVSYGSGRNARKQHSAAADGQIRGPRGRRAPFEPRLHDRPRSKPMRRTDVSLWKFRLARTRPRDDGSSYPVSPFYSAVLALDQY